jgi:hypothetical protein
MRKRQKSKLLFQYSIKNSAQVSLVCFSLLWKNTIYPQCINLSVPFLSSWLPPLKHILRLTLMLLVSL